MKKWYDKPDPTISEYWWCKHKDGSDIPQLMLVGVREPLGRVDATPFGAGMVYEGVETGNFTTLTWSPAEISSSPISCLGPGAQDSLEAAMGAVKSGEARSLLVLWEDQDTEWHGDWGTPGKLTLMGILYRIIHHIAAEE